MDNPNQNQQTHVHEILGSVQIGELHEAPHSHRFATITGEVIPYGTDHYHEVYLLCISSTMKQSHIMT